MIRKTVQFALVSLLLISATLHAAAQGQAAEAHRRATAAAPTWNGGSPPPSAMSLSFDQARAAMKEAVDKKYVGTMKFGILGSRLTYVFSAPTDFRLSTAGFSVVAPYMVDNKPNDGRVSVGFKGSTAGYIQAYKMSFSSCSPGGCYGVGYLPKPGNSPFDWGVFVWSDERMAQRFADAFNRLVYAALQSENKDDFATFSVAAKAWRENPVKPPLSPEADRQRILAENAIQEKNFDSAVGHYESAVEVQPMWPGFWFNLGMLYAEQKDFATAVDRMKHYLELVPDAPDAQNARTQIIIWEDKASPE